jgi:hypothetical protein
MNKNDLSERDICTEFITPALGRARIAIIGCDNMLTVGDAKPTPPISN